MLVDLKVRKCRGCDKVMVEVVREYHLMYCQECHDKYNHLMGQYDN